MRYSLKQLQVFVSTASLQNLSQAAEQLSMSQSAASSALKELEQQFSTQLFDRIGKRLQLSEHGRQVRPMAQALLDQAQALEQQLSGESDAGSLKVGATLTIGNYLAVELIAKMTERHANSEIALQVANTEQIAEQVANYDLDIGLVEGEVQHPDLELVPWRQDRLVLFCNPRHPLASKLNRQGQASISEPQLAQQAWILREAGSGTRQTFNRVMHDKVSQLDVRFELQHTEAIKRAVEADLGIGCLSEIALRDAFQRKSLIELTTAKRDFSRQLYFVLHKKKFHSEMLQQWIKVCQG